MLLKRHTKSSERIPDSAKIKIPSYSKVIDVDMYEGGYGDVYFEVYYLAEDDNDSVGKTINLGYLNVSHSEEFKIDEKWNFFKSCKAKIGGHNHKFFIFMYEELSGGELRDEKINQLL